MRKKLFGSNIATDCSYCENAIFNGNIFNCKKNKQIQNGKCRGFKYDPLLRVPKNYSLKYNYTAEDFKL